MDDTHGERVSIGFWRSLPAGGTYLALRSGRTVTVWYPTDVYSPGVARYPEAFEDGIRGFVRGRVSRDVTPGWVVWEGGAAGWEHVSVTAMDAWAKAALEEATTETAVGSGGPTREGPRTARMLLQDSLELSWSYTVDYAQEPLEARHEWMAQNIARDMLGFPLLTDADLAHVKANR